MINRFRTRCKTCGHSNTLRITLGTDSRQEHTFACAGCGEPVAVALNIDFSNRTSFKELPQFSAPSVEFFCIDNCELCDDEGTITNLDPTFLVPEEMLHQDRVFPWMYEARKIGLINEPTKGAPHINDIIAGLGGQRNLKEILATAVRSFNLASRQQNALSDQQLIAFQKLVGAPNPLTLNSALLLVAILFLGQSRNTEVVSLIEEVRSCAGHARPEYVRFVQYVSNKSPELLARQIEIIGEYLSAYDQLFQVWIYAARGTSIEVPCVASSRDLKNVRMFYGNAFEELSAGLWIPACLNNIKCGRPYDQFREMDLKQYLVINKANRPNPMRDNPVFALLYDEFDSTLRNATHHGAVRVSGNSTHVIEYRSGDAGGWKTMRYTEYLLKCNRIMLCLMRLLAVQLAIVEGLA